MAFLITRNENTIFFGDLYALKCHFSELPSDLVFKINGKSVFNFTDYDFIPFENLFGIIARSDKNKVIQIIDQNLGRNNLPCIRQPTLKENYSISRRYKL